MYRNLDDLLDAAVDAGVPEDQLRNLMRFNYDPEPKQLAFHAAASECGEKDGPTMVAFGGTRGQAKSHAQFAQVAMDDCQREPGLKVLYLRKLAKKANESFADLRRNVLGNVPHTTKQGTIAFPNGSFMVLGGFRSESEIDGYLGIEYDAAIIEDATTLSLAKINVVRGSIRTAKPDWRPRMYLSFNPGGIGHGWAKKMFWEPYKTGTETLTRFVHAQLGDNSHIDPEYEKYLLSLTGWMFDAWAMGSMEISAGQFFTAWDSSVHVIEPFGIPGDWSVWAGMDYGLNHWNATCLATRDGDGNYYIVAEHAARQQLVAQNAPEIISTFSDVGISLSRLSSFEAGHDVFIRRGNTETTVADKYAEYGIDLSPATLDRVNGAANIANLLGNAEASPPIPSRLFIFNTCSHIIEQLPEMLHDPNRGEDVLKVDCNSDSGEGGDDFYDMLRYILMADTHTATVQRY